MRPACLLAFVLGLAAPAAAQTSRVELVVRLAPPALPDGARRAQVQVRDLLADRRWADALDQAFPIRLSYRLEIWRSREGWIDEFQRATEWSAVIQREPLQDQYRVTQIFLSGPIESRFNTRDELARWMGVPNEIDALPQGTGTFYYNVKVKLSALSAEDMDELERFLAGQPATRSNPGRGSIGQRVREFLLRVAGMPSDELEVKSSSFRIERRE
jgi:hypothetical protein